jgi:UDP-N-acetylmuramoylalanine--D-glutamate ligase
MDDLSNKRVTVVGLGHFGGGIATARWLIEQGAKVLVTDRQPREQLADSTEQLADLDVQYRLGEHRIEDFTQTDLVVTSPAVMPTSVFLTAARDAGVPVTTEIRLFTERCPARVIGVTGTKGKSTTTAMLSRMLERSGGRKIWTGGNIGRSLLSDLPNIKPDDLVVLELSSFMLHYLAEAKWSAHVALVTMLAIDHVDWHGSPADYLAAKTSIVKFQKADDWAVLGEAVAHIALFAGAATGRIKWFNTQGRRFALAIPGEHNQFNAQAAFAAASIFNVSFDDAQAAVRDFTGLPHRLELVHEHDGVRYFNDSIATIPEAAVAALAAFEPKTVVQIVGGADKGLAFDGMCSALNERAKAVLCIGKTSGKIETLMKQTASLRQTSVYNCQNLESALKRAKQLVRPGDVVLLSTGCASYDQFTNFEHRGQTFAELARRL